LKREIEALLFAADSPLTAGRLRKLFPEVSNADLKATVEELEADYVAAGHSFTIVEFAGGWQIATRPEYAPLVERLLKTRKYTRLSRAGLEVLAIIAYRQPITRMEVDEIRGVQSSGALATLQERNLLTVVGRSEAVGHPLLYGTTREFLGHLGLKGLTQLPDLPTIEEVVENREDLQAFASQFGTELTDEELDNVRETEEPIADQAVEEIAAELDLDPADDDDSEPANDEPEPVDDEPESDAGDPEDHDPERAEQS